MDFWAQVGQVLAGQKKKLKKKESPVFIYLE